MIKNNIVDFLIQKKFKEVLDAKKEGKRVNFKQELTDELKTYEGEIKKISYHQWRTVKNILDEIEQDEVKPLYINNN